MHNVVGTRFLRVSFYMCSAALIGCAAKRTQTITPTMVAEARNSQAPQAPYALQAEGAGPMANFTLYNMGSQEMKVERAHFAIVQPGGTKTVVPYRDGNAIIDIPPNAVLKPGATLQGKAMFTGYGKLDGMRLVYKPDATGTYADIQPKL